MGKPSSKRNKLYHRMSSSVGQSVMTICGPAKVLQVEGGEVTFQVNGTRLDVSKQRLFEYLKS